MGGERGASSELGAEQEVLREYFGELISLVGGGRYSQILILKKRIKSFSHAIRGSADFIRLGANAKIQLVAALAITATGLLLDFGIYDWIAVVLCIGMVLSAEAMNTAVELLADALHPDRDERIRVVKDLAAGAVLITAIVSVVVAILVVWKHL